MHTGSVWDSRGARLPWYWSIIGACLVAAIMSVVSPAREALAATFTVNQTGDAADASAGDGVCDVDTGTPGQQCSLRAAVQTANDLGGSHTINLPAGTYTLSVGGRNEDAAAGGDLDITADIIVRNVDNAVGSVTIDANDLDRIFDVRPGGTLTVIGVILTDGNPGASSGGAIISQGALTLIGVTVSSSQSGNAGGGIEVTSGTTVIHASTVTGNTAAVLGMGIRSQAGTSLTVTHSLVSGNTGGGSGGLDVKGTVSISDTAIDSNQATGVGGISMANGTLMMNRVTVSNNSVTGAVGGLFIGGHDGNANECHVLGQQRREQRRCRRS